MSVCLLSNALVALLPGAIITRTRETDWHSATFSGKRIALTLQKFGFDLALENRLSLVKENEFSLIGQYVADIAVVKVQSTAEGHLLEIEALLLDEEI